MAGPKQKLMVVDDDKRVTSNLSELITLVSNGEIEPICANGISQALDLIDQNGITSAFVDLEYEGESRSGEVILDRAKRRGITAIPMTDKTGRVLDAFRQGYSVINKENKEEWMEFIRKLLCSSRLHVDGNEEIIQIDRERQYLKGVIDTQRSPSRLMTISLGSMILCTISYFLSFALHIDLIHPYVSVGLFLLGLSFFIMGGLLFMEQEHVE